MSLVIGFLLIVPLCLAIPRWHQGRLVFDEAPKELNNKYSKKFTQQLDHFDRENEATFDQRYFLNDTFWKGEDSSPVFLCVGGEGPPLDWTVLVSSVHCNDMVELAGQVGALMVALEHRYYGPSNPFDNLATENLKWLNTEQALADIASFHSLISEQYSLKPTNKWVTWGGSYPGMVAALARLRYPHLIHACVSSSSPLVGVVNMVGYNDVVAQSMASEDVGGSAQCLSIIQSGHKTIGDLLTTDDGRRSLEKTFNTCQANVLDDAQNREQFAGDGVVYLPVQSNDPSCTTPHCDIASICTLLTNETLGTPVDRLAAMSAIQNGGNCVALSYSSMISSLKVPSNPERTWLYQTCTEWGFYQTCEVGSQCPYTQGLHTLAVDYNICKEAFGIDQENVDYWVNYSTTTYGGANIQGTRIMYPSGQIDPWHANSILASPNDEEPVLMVRAASHHFWTHPVVPSDTVYVNEARQQIWDQVTKWLQE
jgi:serine protease 16